MQRIIEDIWTYLAIFCIAVWFRLGWDYGAKLEQDIKELIARLRSRRRS